MFPTFALPALAGISTTLAASSSEAPSSPGLDLNSLLSGGGGALAVGLGYYVFRVVVDRAIPTRSDARASTSQVLEGLSNMVKVLQEEKIADATRLTDKQGRIDLLEDSADKDYERIRELRTEILDLSQRLALKDRHIRILVLELRKLGAQVTGVDDPQASSEDIEVTLSGEQAAALREQNETEDTAGR